MESILNDPPTNPNPGVSYIVGATPSGAWVGHTNNIARWSGEEWKYEAPAPGWRTFIKSTATHQVFTSSWQDWAVGGSATGNIDGGEPDSNYGGTTPIDGGGV